MAKQKKNNHSVIPSVQAGVKGLKGEDSRFSIIFRAITIRPLGPTREYFHLNTSRVRMDIVDLDVSGNLHPVSRIQDPASNNNNHL